MIKILWFSNANLSTSCRFSGSWLYTMSESLTKQENVVLINITQVPGIKIIQKYQLSGNLKQYVIPIYRLFNGLPSDNHIQEIVSIVNQEKPDIIHIWGSESYWGLLTARGYIKGRILLEMQGLISSCYNAYYASLTPYQLFKCYSLKEFLKPISWLPFVKKKIGRMISRENEIIRKHNHIAVQSLWVERYVKSISPQTFFYHSLISVRPPFLNQEWHISKNEIKELTAVISEVPYKGLLDIIQSLYIVKQEYSHVKLNVIGKFSTKTNNIRTSGYERLVLSKIKELGLDNNIQFFGPLDASAMAKIFLKSDVFVQASYVESYSLVVAEAMAIGMPCVISYAGAMPELAQDGESAYFYPCGDFVICASCILDLLKSEAKSIKLGRNARSVGLIRNNARVAVDRQMMIYNHLMSAECN